MIRIADVTHHYGIRPVLRRVNLQIDRGQIVALMGPNGMGKTTLMSVAAGILPPLKGYVEIDGKRRRRSEDEELAIRKMVAYLSAEPWVPAGRSGREWLMAVGELYAVDGDRLMDHVDRLLTLFDLTNQGDSPVGSYSTGQKKKIAIAAVLVTDAPVLLLDEPFSGGLDPSGITALKRVLQYRARQQGGTILMATPVPELVEDLADRVAVLHEGQILACDTIDGLRKAAAVEGRLDAVYAALVNPSTAQNIERYFQEPGS